MFAHPFAAAVRIPLLVVCWSLAVSATSLADVWIVDAGGGGDFLDVQAAVNAASDGDVVLIQAGVYAAVTITDKALRLAAYPNANVRLSRMSVLDLAAGKSLLLSDLIVWSNGSERQIHVSDCTGSVRIQACQIGKAEAGRLGLELENAADVVVSRSEIYGGLSYTGFPDAVRASHASLALESCTVIGGDGAGQCKEDGGAGVDVVYSTLFVSGSHVRGGNGNDTWPSGGFCCDAGNGGDGLYAALSDGWSIDSTYEGGWGGFSYSIDCSHGDDGNTYDNEDLIVLSGNARTLEVPSLVSESTSFLMAFEGSPGDDIWLFRSHHGQFRMLPDRRGVLALGFPLAGATSYLGQIPSSGRLEVTFPGFALGASMENLEIHLQPMIRTASNEVRLGESAHLSVIDSSIQL